MSKLAAHVPPRWRSSCPPPNERSGPGTRACRAASPACPCRSTRTWRAPEVTYTLGTDASRHNGACTRWPARRPQTDDAPPPIPVPLAWKTGTQATRSISQPRATAASAKLRYRRKRRHETPDAPSHRSTRTRHALPMRLAAERGWLATARRHPSPARERVRTQPCPASVQPLLPPKALRPCWRAS